MSEISEVILELLRLHWVVVGGVHCVFISCEGIDMCGAGERASVERLNLVVDGMGCIMYCCYHFMRRT